MFGGLDTPVSIAIVPFANQNKVPFMGVWAAGTPITRNGAAENYVFRVSAVDVLVDKALVDYAIKKYATKKPGMILINNPWGESNEKGLKEALAEKNMSYAGIEKFQDADVDVVPQLTRLKDAGADVLFMVANVAPSLTFVNSKGEAEGVKYSRLNIVVINAVKEQQQQIEQQQKQIATLVTSNTALNARLRGVEKSLRKKAGSARRRR